MKTFLILSAFTIEIVILFFYWFRSTDVNNPLRRRLCSLFGYGQYRQPNTIHSLWFWGLLLRRNPFPVEVRVDPAGVYIIRRVWFGLTVYKMFYPMSMVQTITVTESFGFFARITIAIRLNLQIVPLRIDRYFRVSEANSFFEQWQIYTTN